MHSQVLTLRLKLPMTKFIRSVLAFHKVAPSQLSAVAWRMVLEFEALLICMLLKCAFSRTLALFTKEDYPGFATSPQGEVEKLLSTWSIVIMICGILWFKCLVCERLNLKMSVG